MKFGLKSKGSQSNWIKMEWNNELNKTTKCLKFLYNPDTPDNSAEVGDRDLEIIRKDPNETAWELKSILIDYIQNNSEESLK